MSQKIKAIEKVLRSRVEFELQENQGSSDELVSQSGKSSPTGKWYFLRNARVRNKVILQCKGPCFKSKPFFETSIRECWCWGCWFLETLPAECYKHSQSNFPFAPESGNPECSPRCPPQPGEWAQGRAQGGEQEGCELEEPNGRCVHPADNPQGGK